MKILILILIMTSIFVLSASAVILEGDDQTELCKEIKTMAYPTAVCRSDYQQYPPKSSAKSSKDIIQIAGFNMLQPGTKSSRYKHIPSLLNMMNKWDVIGTTELMSLDAYTMKYNRLVLNAFGSSTKKSVNNKFKRMYRLPGYLVLLKELQKRDKTWGLLLTPSKQGSPSANIRELVGVFYRGRYVTPMHNKYCASNYKKRSKSYACLPKFKQSVEETFSRKPIVASFKSGRFKFTILTSHVVFGSASNRAPRLFELDQMTKLMKNPELRKTTRNIILVGDLNLEHNDKGVDTALNGFDMFSLKPSSLSASKGYSKNYDHFVFDPTVTKRCDGAGANVFDMINKSPIMKKYEPMLVNESSCTKNSAGKYAKLSDARVHDLQGVYCQYMGKISNSKMVNKKKEIVYEYNDKHLQIRSGKFLNTIVFSQSKTSQAYRKYLSVLSDHAPIHMSCGTSSLRKFSNYQTD